MKVRWKYGRRTVILRSGIVFEVIRLRHSAAAERYAPEDEDDFAGSCIVRAGTLEERLAIAFRMRSAFLDRLGTSDEPPC